jgi:hypothetical protein
LSARSWKNPRRQPSHYRSTYLASFGLTVLALLAGFLLHSKFMALGGPDHYVARE